DSGAKAIVIVENFAHTLQQVLAKTSVEHVVLATLGDLLGFPKGPIVNMVVRKVKKMVPAFSLPGATRFNDAIAAGGGTEVARRRGLAPVYGRHNGHFEGGDATAP